MLPNISTAVEGNIWTEEGRGKGEVEEIAERGAK